MKLFVATLILALSAFGLQAAAPKIFEGAWEDGTKIEWQCAPGTSGKVGIRVTTVDESQYTAVLSCGNEV